MKNLKAFLAVILSFSIFLSCDKDKEEVVVKPRLEIGFDYVFGASMEDWRIEEFYVHPKTGDSLYFSMLQFYISNIQLESTNGSFYTVPGGIWLMDAEDKGLTSIVINDIPEGQYIRMHFTLGIDSLSQQFPRNGALGDLSVRIKGNSPQSQTGSFAFDFGEAENLSVLSKTLQTNFFGEPQNLMNGSKLSLLFAINPARFWHNQASLSVLNGYTGVGETAIKMTGPFFEGAYLANVQLEQE